MNKVKGIDGVKDVTHANWFGGYYQQPANQVVTMAVEPETYFDVYSELVIDPQQKAKWLGNRTGILVGERLARVQ